jgi:hypothetical protein
MPKVQLNDGRFFKNARLTNVHPTGEENEKAATAHIDGVAYPVHTPLANHESVWHEQEAEEVDPEREQFKRDSALLRFQLGKRK